MRQEFTVQTANLLAQLLFLLHISALVEVRWVKHSGSKFQVGHWLHPAPSAKLPSQELPRLCPSLCLHSTAGAAASTVIVQSLHLPRVWMGCLPQKGAQLALPPRAPPRSGGGVRRQLSPGAASAHHSKSCAS